MVEKIRIINEYDFTSDGICLYVCMTRYLLCESTCYISPTSKLYIPLLDKNARMCYSEICTVSFTLFLYLHKLHWTPSKLFSEGPSQSQSQFCSFMSLWALSMSVHMKHTEWYVIFISLENWKLKFIYFVF